MSEFWILFGIPFTEPTTTPTEKPEFISAAFIYTFISVTRVSRLGDPSGRDKVIENALVGRFQIKGVSDNLLLRKISENFFCPNSPKLCSKLPISIFLIFSTSVVRIRPNNYTRMMVRFQKSCP